MVNDIIAIINDKFTTIDSLMMIADYRTKCINIYYFDLHVCDIYIGDETIGVYIYNNAEKHQEMFIRYEDFICVDNFVNDVLYHIFIKHV